MATYQELRTRSQQVRDEQNIGGNTALRVGQLLMDIVKYFYDNDTAASEYLDQHFAKVNDETQQLNWQQSPIVLLQTMGADYDDGDPSALSQGENYFNGWGDYIMEADGHGGGINGEHPKADVLYVNLANDTLYRWNGASFDPITSGGDMGAVVSGDTLILSGSSSSPTVIVGNVGNNSLSCRAGNTATTSFSIRGRNLSGNIAIAVSDPTNWSVSPASISPVGGNVSTTQVVITYHPAPGTAPETQQQCTITITCDGITYGTISMNGTVADAPSIILSPSTLTLSTVENEPKTGVINVKGKALEGNITLAISGTGFTLSTNSVSKADAEMSSGVDVVVTFDGAANGSATITASSTNATNTTASVAGTLVSRKSEGDTFNVGMLTYTVLADTSTVSVKSNGATGDITVPSSVDDENGIAYTVTALTYEAFNGSPITSIVLPSSLTTAIGGSGGYSTYSHAFQNCRNLVSVNTGGLTSLRQEMFKNCSRLTSITINSVVSILTNALMGCPLTELLLPDSVTTLNNAWLGLSNSTLRKLQIGTSSSCAISSVWFNKLNALETLIVFKPTPPGWAGAFHQLQNGGGFARGFRNYQSGLTSDSASETFDTNGTGKLYVPAGSVSSYENADPIPYGQPNPWRYMKGDANLAGDSSGRIYEITDDILLS